MIYETPDSSHQMHCSVETHLANFLSSQKIIVTNQQKTHKIIMFHQQKQKNNTCIKTNILENEELHPVRYFKLFRHPCIGSSSCSALFPGYSATKVELSSSYDSMHMLAYYFWPQIKHFLCSVVKEIPPDHQSGIMRPWLEKSFSFSREHDAHEVIICGLSSMRVRVSWSWSCDNSWILTSGKDSKWWDIYQMWLKPWNHRPRRPTRKEGRFNGPSQSWLPTQGFRRPQIPQQKRGHFWVGPNPPAFRVIASQTKIRIRLTLSWTPRHVKSSWSGIYQDWWEGS